MLELIDRDERGCASLTAVERQGDRTRLTRLPQHRRRIASAPLGVQVLGGARAHAEAAAPSVLTILRNVRVRVRCGGRAGLHGAAGTAPPARRRVLPGLRRSRRHNTAAAPPRARHRTARQPGGGTRAAARSERGSGTRGRPAGLTLQQLSSNQRASCAAQTKRRDRLIPTTKANNRPIQQRTHDPQGDPHRHDQLAPHAHKDQLCRRPGAPRPRRLPRTSLSACVSSPSSRSAPLTRRVLR